MSRRKEYRLPPTASLAALPSDGPVLPWEFRTNHATHDMRRLLWVGLSPYQDAVDGHGTYSPQRGGTAAHREELVFEIRRALAQAQNRVASTTLDSYCHAVFLFFAFLDQLATARRPVQRLADIDLQLIQIYLDWLSHRSADTDSGRLSVVTRKARYSHLKAVLMDRVRAGLLDRGIFPRNPFPNIRRAVGGEKHLSQRETERLLGALVKDLIAIRSGTFKGSAAEALVVYLFIIAIRSGTNRTPLLELSRDALQPHPLKPEGAWILTTYKRRGYKVHFHTESKNIDTITAIRSDVATLYHEALAMTAPLVAEAAPGDQERLWLFRSERGISFGRVAALSNSAIARSTVRILKRHGLTGDDEQALRLNISRLRKTFVNRIWKLTGGDLIKTAKLTGNTPQITDSHYLEVTPEMRRNHKFVGLALDITLRGHSKQPEAVARLASQMKVSVDDVVRLLRGDFNTPVGRCSNPLGGKYSPKDGTACTKFLHCFRCPNQVVTGDPEDLHRLFSFYWLLIRERNLLGRNQWKTMYGWVIREIDRVIAPKFDPEIVREAREQAKRNPHPMWRDRALLMGSTP